MKDFEKWMIEKHPEYSEEPTESGQEETEQQVSSMCNGTEENPY